MRGNPIQECGGLDCQGCDDCVKVSTGRPSVEIAKKGIYLGFSQYVRTIERKGETLPALLARSDGATILYAGKVNSVFGEPGMGKSWIAIQAALAALEQGGRVLWWDFEDRPDTLYRRAEALGKLDLITGENVAFIDSNHILELDDTDYPTQGLSVPWNGLRVQERTH